nr:restriction endonuclease subunit S [Enterococcus devriesei]
MSKNIPQLRFEGFTYDWKQRKLGTLAKFSKGKGYTKGDLIEDGVPIILYGRLYTKYQTIISDIDTYVDALENSVLSEGSEVIVPSSGETSEDIARAAVVDNKGVILGGDLNIIKPSKKLESSFLALTISNGEAQKELMKKAQGNSVVHLYNNDLKEVKLFYPDNLEQTKIGNFFKTLDDTITLHQRKLDLLKEQKKGYLQKMFPKNGAKVPELRFAGFADDWEERKLSEGTSKIGDGLHGTPNYSDNGDVFFINGNNLVNGKIVITKETKLVTESNQSKDDKLLNMDTILMSINGTIGNLAWYNNERVMLGKSAAYLTVSNFDKKFIFSYLQTSTIKNYFLNNLTGTTIKNLGLKTIRDTTLFVPTLEEQQKIGLFFKQLDNTITLHQRKLDLLKEQKKGFLQNMFV